MAVALVLAATSAAAANDATTPSPLMTAVTPSPATTMSAVVPTPSQRDNPQLNQLFQFEATPNICAAGEGYLSGQFNYLRLFSDFNQYRYQLQGQYGVTDQVAVGAYVPYLYNSNRFNDRTTNGVGDVVLYAQYKFDQLIDPKLLSLTAHVSVVLPTGDDDDVRDTGRFGVRPLVLGYKDFGLVGPGRLGAYAQLGFTISNDADVRWGVAATYEYAHFVGVVELTGQDGSDYYGNIALLTHGIVYRGFENFELAVAVPLGLTNDSPDWGVTAKVTYAFPN